jgi:hypothetical protein
MISQPLFSLTLLGNAMVLVSLAAIIFQKKISERARKNNSLLEGPDFTFRTRKVKNSSAMKNVRKMIEALVG